MGRFLRYMCGLFLAASLPCTAFGQTGEHPQPRPLTIAKQQVSMADQQAAESQSGLKSAANPNPAQARIRIHGRVLDQFGAVVGNATVLLRARASGGCDFKSGSAEFIGVTNQFGEFSAALPPGVYGVWVQGYPKPCVEATVTESPATPQPIMLKVTVGEEVVDPALPESRFQKIAGSGVLNCGHVDANKDRTQATACALRAYKHRKAFYVIYGQMGYDSIVSTGVAWNGKDVPYIVEYDSMGLSGDSLWPGSSMPDGSHTIVDRCSKPLRVFVDEEGKLDCFRDREMWEELILERGRRETFLNAGETGYKELVPALKKRLADPEANDDPEDKEGLLLALAKLGDREQMQALVCQLHTGSPLEMQTVALDNISYVGGWYAIRIYRELLTPAAKARFEKAKLREQADLALSEPQWWALTSLLKVAPYPPPPGIGYGFNLAVMPEYAKIWLDAIQKNEGKLKKLEPTGVGVDFAAKSCKH